MNGRYRKNYIKEMRKDVGHAPLWVTGCGIIIENDTDEAVEYRFLIKKVFLIISIFVTRRLYWIG